MKHFLKTPYLKALLASKNAIYKSSKAFIKPIKQDFIKDNSILPMNRCMLALLVGWAGREQAIETTRGIIAKHIGRSVRQVSRYLVEAVEAGYLTYAYTKDRIGYITGIKIYLNFAALKPLKPAKKVRKTAERRAVTSMADTNSKYIYKKGETESEQKFLDKIDEICKRNGIAPYPT